METKTLPALQAGEYAGGLWYYEPHIYMPYRYVLGRPGHRPLVCIGINPSTAQPGALDPTVKSVERLAASNGFDSWIMFNVYPQRATDPNDMDLVPDRALCDENLRWLAAVLAQTQPTMWAADGGADPGKRYPLGHHRQTKQKGPPPPPALSAQGRGARALRCGGVSEQLLLRGRQDDAKQPAGDVPGPVPKDTDLV